MQFTKVRLSGFKSFVDNTELDIMPGVTGIVGPNGCGKSNIVESLKWVMGETSAKQMRGSEMDDVIFAGTQNRPARNIAEVVLTLDNADRSAPAAFNDAELLEISRKIEREKGSTYRVNGNEVRARDVHLLFADQASGARSTALVSQGHIGRIIGSKPTERRHLIEEAAGIVGLHSRRHEAELRLKAAESNLERLEDVLVTMETQLQSLKKQARQAARYRNLNDHIRKAEAVMFTLHWNAATAEFAQAEEMLREAETTVNELTGAAAHAATAQAEAAALLPPLREAEARAAAALQRLNLARESLEEERQRIEAARRDAVSRLAHVTDDSSREAALLSDADVALQRLTEEETELGGAAGSEEEAVAAAQMRLNAAREQAEAAEAELAALTRRLAEQDARRADFARRTTEINQRLDRLRSNAGEVARQIAEIQASAIGAAVTAEAEARVSEAAERVETQRQTLQIAETTRAEAVARADETGQIARAAGGEADRLNAEIAALARVLEAGDPDLWPPVIDAIRVAPGYEAALGAALGDDLSASTDSAAPIHWQMLDGLELPILPEGCDSLLNHVNAPAALTRRLSQIGIVSDAETAARLFPQLRNGQRLVTLQGALWRWDGFVAAAEAPTSAAVRLAQKNSLAELRQKQPALAERAAIAEAADQEARAGLRMLSDAEGEARRALAQTERDLSTARNALVDLQRKVAEQDSRLAARRDNAERLAADIAEAEETLAEVHAMAAEVPDAEPGRLQAEEGRTLVNQRRGGLIEAQSDFDTLSRQIADRRRRLTAIASELASWRERRDGAMQRQTVLAERRATIEDEIEALSGKPAEIEARNIELLSLIETAEHTRQEAADKLAAQERTTSEADKALREAEGRLGNARENRVRAESGLEQAKQSTHALTERIADRLRCAPETLREVAELQEDSSLPDLESAERRVERLLHERETMGPVNLRAETEAEELGTQMEGLQSEKNDLVAAIDKLRRGIQELNREGRERFLASFKLVDEHFQQLFVRLFGGGKAYLTLTESEDPLEAGIEIMASPPGKKMQVLSLLSGGEQALTALSLLFAVFLTNPAPICVLDEVDAPLDEANVDRFCTMVSEMAATGMTRFLVITHHRMTMARMDRLYGVTMGERGISQLVSVDLSQAMEIRATA